MEKMFRHPQAEAILTPELKPRCFIGPRHKYADAVIAFCPLRV